MRWAEQTEKGVGEAVMRNVGKEFEVESSFRDDYEEYIHSESWREKRREYFRSGSGKKCRGCGDSPKQIHLHHKTYERMGHEELDDLVPVCKVCHLMIHERHKLDDISLWDATELVLSKIQTSIRRPISSQVPKRQMKRMPVKKYKQRYMEAAAYAVSGVRRDSRPSASWERTNDEYSKIRDREVERQGQLKKLGSF